MRTLRIILAGLAVVVVAGFFLVATGAVADPAERHVQTARQAPREASEAVPVTVPTQVPTPEPETVIVDRAYVPAACAEAIRVGNQVMALAAEGQAVANDLTAYLSSLSADVTYGEAYPTIAGFYGRANGIAVRSGTLVAAWQAAAAGCHG